MLGSIERKPRKGSFLAEHLNVWDLMLLRLALASWLAVISCDQCEIICGTEMR